MRSSRSLDGLWVTADDPHAVDHAGLVLVATLAERLGLAQLVDEHVVLKEHGAHASDKVLTIVHALVAGADCIDDLDLLRAGATEAVLGHSVVAPSTAGTFLRAISLGHVRQLDAVLGETFGRLRALGGASPDVVVDVDSTLCETYGLMKEGARKVMRTGRRGYHPIIAATEDGDVVHVRLRRGRTNDGSGAARFVGETLARLKRTGADTVVLRADSGFYQRDVVDACRRRGVGFSIGARIHRGMAQAISSVPDQAWVPIDYPYGEGAAVAEVPWVAFSKDPHGERTGGIPVRLLIRRVPPSPGIQAPLFPTYSYHPFVTDRPGDIVELDRFHRAHAKVEAVIKDLKHHGGLAHLPSGRFGANSAWLVLCALAYNLVRAVGRLGMGETTRSLKTLRRRVLSVPGRLTRSGRHRRLHLPAQWPWATQFLAAWDRLRNLVLVT